MASPAVSVIIPVYNGSNYLREAIASVDAQSFRDHELIVVDDGSTDDTWSIVQSYGDRIRAFRKANGGVASALNLGIANAAGRWIAWLSHDDLFFPTKLDRQVAFLRASSRFQACYTDYVVIDASGNRMREVVTPWYPRDRAIRALFGRAYIGGSTMLIERACFDTVGPFNEKLRYSQDTEMWLRLLRHFDIGRVPQVLAAERVHAAQGSHRVEAMRRETQAMYMDFFGSAAAAGFFANGDGARDAHALAREYRWLGDTFAMHRRWFSFADDQYRRSAALWSSWRNSARWKLWLGARRVWIPLRVAELIRGGS